MRPLFLIAQALADGNIHSGEDLGARFQMTRAAVWKSIQQLMALHVPIEAVRGQGYRIAGGLELLNQQQIESYLPREQRTFSLEIFPEITSTQTYLLDLIKQGTLIQQPHICVSEYQKAGRGRRERSWFCSFGHNIYLSLAWRFETFPRDFSALSLMVAVSVARVLHASGVDVGLKWPNDLVYQDKKLGGVLLEVQGQSEGPLVVVIGIGINGQLPTAAYHKIEQPWTDFKQVTGQTLPRNRVIGLLINELLTAIPQFEAQGLAPFLPDWHRFDSLIGRMVDVQTALGKQTGIMRGIDMTGALQVELDREMRLYRSGEVSVRVQK